MKGVVVTTSQYTREFLKDCLDSLKGCNYPILVVSNGGYRPGLFGEDIPQNDIIHIRDNKDTFGTRYDLVINEWNGWELGGIERGKERFSEFVHIMDTTLLKDLSLFDKLFEIEGNVALTKDHFHYMGKYVTKLLPNTPRIHTKDMGIFMETTWLDKTKNYSEFKPDLPVHTDNFTTIHGEKRMVLENDYLIKYKGTFFRSAEHP